MSLADEQAWVDRPLHADDRHGGTSRVVRETLERPEAVALEAEDAHRDDARLTGVDDRCAAVDAEHADVGDGDGAAGHVGRRRLPGLGRLDQVAGGARHLGARAHDVAHVGQQVAGGVLPDGPSEPGDIGEPEDSKADEDDVLAGDRGEVREPRSAEGVDQFGWLVAVVADDEPGEQCVVRTGELCSTMLYAGEARARSMRFRTAFSMRASPSYSWRGASSNRRPEAQTTSISRSMLVTPPRPSEARPGACFYIRLREGQDELARVFASTCLMMTAQ